MSTYSQSLPVVFRFVFEMIEAEEKKEVLREFISEPIEFQDHTGNKQVPLKRIRQKLTDEAVEKHRSVYFLVRLVLPHRTIALF